MRFPFRIVLLAAFWLSMQFMLAMHGIGHAHADIDHGNGVCTECLALAGLQGAAPSPCANVSLLPSATGGAFAAAASPAPSFAHRQSYLSRAPPVLPS